MGNSLPSSSMLITQLSSSITRTTLNTTTRTTLIPYACQQGGNMLLFTIRSMMSKSLCLSHDRLPKQVQSPSALAYQQAHCLWLGSYGNARTDTKQGGHASLACNHQQDAQCFISSLPDKGAWKPPVKSAICQIGHVAALAHHVHNSAATAIPLHQVNATTRQYCHT